MTTFFLKIKFRTFPILIKYSFSVSLFNSIPKNTLSSQMFHKIYKECPGFQLLTPYVITLLSYTCASIGEHQKETDYCSLLINTFIKQVLLTHILYNRVVASEWWSTAPNLKFEFTPFHVESSFKSLETKNNEHCISWNLNNNQSPMLIPCPW
jgi:hypothetical protein